MGLSRQPACWARSLSAGAAPASADWLSDQSLAVAMQPDHFGAKGDGLGEQLGIGREWYAQARADEIGLEA
jgi:hypothetical protein